MPMLIGPACGKGCGVVAPDCTEITRTITVLPVGTVKGLLNGVGAWLMGITFPTCPERLAVRAATL